MIPDANRLNDPTPSNADEATSPMEARRAALRHAVSGERFIAPARTPKMTQEEWREFILSVAGSIPDPSFRRHDQGTFEQRDEL